jgi:hypothetical protein
MTVEKTTMGFKKQTAAQTKKPAETARKHKKPRFLTMAGSEGPFIRLNASDGRVNFVGVDGSDEKLMCRDAVVVHMDLDRIEEGWVNYAGKGPAILGDDEKEQPEKTGKYEPQWGIVVPVAMPYSITVEGVEIANVPEHTMRLTAGTVIGAMQELYEAWEETLADSDDNDRVAIVEITRWEKESGSGGKSYYSPVLTLLGTTSALEEPNADYLEALTEGADEADKSFD